MPYINLKLTGKTTNEKNETLKAGLGAAITLIPGKNEGQLMVCIEDQQQIWLAGKKLDAGANVSVSYFGNADGKDLEKVSTAIFDLLNKEMGSPAVNIYIEYQPIYHWGAGGGTAHIE